MIDWSTAKKPLIPGEEPGDCALCEPLPEGFLVAVVDALGHGPDAAAAAQRAVGRLRKNAGEPLDRLVLECHEELKWTRGAVMSLASFDFVAKTISWMGVGNVEGAMFRAARSGSPIKFSLTQRAGVIGYDLPALKASTIRLEPGDTLIFVTDGVRLDFADGLDPTSSPGQLVDYLMTFAKENDDSLALVARYLGVSS
jgi:phosphoserine phosphatase RsbX